MLASMNRILIALLAFASTAGLAAAGIDHPPPGARGAREPWMRSRSDANLPDMASRRSRLVTTYCGQCHAPPPPELHSSDEWRWLIVRMDMRAWAAGRPSVRVASNDELREIARYYDAHSED